MDPGGVGRRPPVRAPLDELYEARFDEREVSAKQGVWDEIARYLQRYVDPNKPVLDLACDRGHFVRPIKSSEKWATDIRDMSAVAPARRPFRAGVRPGAAIRRCRSRTSGRCS